MIASLHELEESLAFERWALSGLVPMGSSRPYIGTKDLVGRAVTVLVGGAVEVNVAVGSVKRVTVDLRPLAFGLAWKMLDLVLEYSFEKEGRTPSNRHTWRIEEKTLLAREGAGTFPPVSDHRTIWESLLAVYAETDEVRHSLVHRKAEVDQTSGTLVGTDRNGRPLRPLTTDEQEGFCRAVQRATEAGLSDRLTSRELADLEWQLDLLAPIHGAGNLGGVELGRAALIYAPLTIGEDGLQELDVPETLAGARASWPTLGLFDVQVELPNGRSLVGELEHAPAEVVRFDADRPPAWLMPGVQEGEDLGR